MRCAWPRWYGRNLPTTRPRVTLTPSSLGEPVDVRHAPRRLLPVDHGRDVLVLHLERGERALDDRRAQLERKCAAEVELRVPAQALLAGHLRRVVAHAEDALA